MRFRLGLFSGFAAGYYLGAKAGRERYEQLNRLAAKVRRSGAYQGATENVREAVEVGVERVRDLVDERGDEDRHPSEGDARGTAYLRPVDLRDVGRPD